MSAFEVDKTHIDVLISAALQRVHGDTLNWIHGDLEWAGGWDAYQAAITKAKREVTKENAGTWGATLAAENRRSVNYRYEEDEIEDPYEFTEYAGHFDPAKILAAISCYEYQACEHPEWKTSEAKSFCEALMHRMIRLLPGYGQVWEVTDASEVTVGQAMRVASAAEMRRRLR
jgi:hypothetical protein